MTQKLAFPLIVLLFLLSNCSQFLNKKQKVKYMSANHPIVSSITFLENNNAFITRGIEINRPDWALCFSKFDSLYIYIPNNKFKSASLYIGFDNLKAYQGRKPDFEIGDLSTSCIIKMKPAFYQKYDTLIGAIRCWELKRKFDQFFPFNIPLK